MRARRRRSVMNTISAAALEVAIMGIFVIIAQPQLRDALFEILQVDQTVPIQPAQVQSAQLRPTEHQAVVSTDRPTNAIPARYEPPAMSDTVQAVVDSRVGQAAGSTLHDWAAGLRPELNRPAQPPQPTTPAHVAGFSPYEQYESFRVQVGNNQWPANPVAQNSFQPGQVPTQLTPNQWNIASAPQTPRQWTGSNANNWVPPHATETSYRQIYPPPYGTQSMWK